MAGNGSPDAHAGCAIYLFAANRSMQRRFFYDADGEMLIVPQQGALTLDTELGRIQVSPQEIAVIPRGLRYRVNLANGEARGYVCENFGAPFKLHAIFLRRGRATRSSTSPANSSANSQAACGLQKWITHRSMLSHGMATTRLINTICGDSIP